jgi:CPA1 family monovalent cation:H+ antiporter
VFVLIGLQLRGLLDRLERYDPWELAGLGFGVSAALIAGRFAWVFAATWLPRALSRSLRERDPLPPPSHTTVIAWAGMRGVVSLAAALALPAEFPRRDIILFLAFCAILATLVVQGTTLGPLIRRLGVSEPEDEPENPGATAEAGAARGAATAAAMEAVAEKAEDPEHAAVADDVLRDLRGRAERADHLREDEEGGAQRLSAQLNLRLTAIEAARAKLLAEHKEELDSEAVTALVSELDLEEEQIRVALGER